MSYNAINSPKINWYMSLVDDKKRGSFTANKEIVSLIGGMLFSFALGAIVDHFASKTSFILCGVIIFALMIMHTATLVFTTEKKGEAKKVDVKKSIFSLIKNKPLLKVIIVFDLCNIANYATISFSGALGWRQPTC